MLVWLVVGPLTDFSLVALLENEQWRTAKATQRKLNALAEAPSHILAAEQTSKEEVEHHVEQLRAAVGLEKRESISD